MICPLTFVGGHHSVVPCPLATVRGHVPISAYPSANARGYAPTSAYLPTNIRGYAPVFAYPSISVSGHHSIIACPPTNVRGHAPTSAYPSTIVSGHATIAAYPPRCLGGHAAIGNRVLLFRIRVNRYSENRLPLQIHHPFGDKVLCRASEYSILSHQAFFRPSGCFLQSRKYSVARHDALLPRSMTILGQDWSFSDRRKYSVSRQSTQSCRNEHPIGRHDASSSCGSTLTAVTMLPPSAQILCRASEYSIF